MGSNKSAQMKVYTHLPKPNSKNQQKKAEYVKAHPIKVMGCKNCGKTDVTLYNVDGVLYCKEHKPE